MNTQVAPGMKVSVEVRHFAADPRFAFPGASFQPTEVSREVFDVVIDAAAIGYSLVPSEWRRPYINMCELPRLLRQQHGVYGQYGVSFAA